MNRYFDRIWELENNDFIPLARLICCEYNLGNLEYAELVEIGYEDFNAIISTISGKYLVKIFSKNRTLQETIDCIQRTDVAGKNVSNVPKIIYNKFGDKLTQIRLNGRTYNISLLSFINGHDYFTLNEKPSLHELEKIVGIACELSEIKFDPSYIYDKWAIPNFPEAFNEKRKYLSEEHLSLINNMYYQFCRFDYNSLPKAFVHGDMTSTNVMRDDSGGIWLVDFSVSNYMARVIEIVIICADLAIIEYDGISSKQRIEHCFNLWCTRTNATIEEKASFKMLFSIANAIYVLNTSYELHIGNNSRENISRLNQGLFGLTLFE